jgi:hypothetical protein
MLILADRSSSMTETRPAPKCPPCYQTRWEGSVAAIKGVTADLDHAIDFGLMLFPSLPDANSPKPDGIDCNVGMVSVELGAGVSGQIASVLDAAKPQGATPTAGALREAKRVLVDDPAGLPDFQATPAYVLLVSDGEPTCQNLKTGVREPETTLAALDVLRAAAVPTYVVGYGISASSGPGQTMDAMAQHGGTGHFYPAEGETELVAALTEITQSVVSCDFALENDPPRGDEYIHVTIDGEDVSPGDQGWTRAERVVRLRGAACDKLRDGGTHALEIVVECEPVIVL